MTDEAAALDPLAQLRRLNVERQLAWADGTDPGLMFHAVELGGEAGEVLNVVKKIERERNGWRGSRATLADLADEIADVVICVDKLAASVGIDLWPAVVAKFNATSEKVGLPQKLANRPTPPVSRDAGMLVDALEFYRDMWGIDDDYNPREIAPRKELRRDAGSRAREALAAYSRRSDGGEEAPAADHEPGLGWKLSPGARDEIERLVSENVHNAGALHGIILATLPIAPPPAPEVGEEARATYQAEVQRVRSATDDDIRPTTKSDPTSAIRAAFLDGWYAETTDHCSAEEAADAYIARMDKAGREEG